MKDDYQKGSLSFFMTEEVVQLSQLSQKERQIAIGQMLIKAARGFVQGTPIRITKAEVIDDHLKKHIGHTVTIVLREDKESTE